MNEVKPNFPDLIYRLVLLAPDGSEVDAWELPLDDSQVHWSAIPSASEIESAILQLHEDPPS